MPTLHSKLIQNFGRNLSFQPEHFYSPNSEDELLSTLQNHKNDKIRVIASGHSWSSLVETEDVLIDMRHFSHVQVFEKNGVKQVRVGAGCQLKHLVKALNKQGLTIPSLGLITEQTIAGATATGTHGSGKHSLSHYINSVKVACFKDNEDIASVVEVNDGIELQAARCSLGCLGVITEITLPCIPQYFLQEKGAFCETIEQVLTLEKQSPIQQFYILPHAWKFFVQQRKVSTEKGRKGLAGLYRVYWFLVIDLALHLVLKLLASIIRSNKLIRAFFKKIAPALVFTVWEVTDRSDRTLVMEHELFRHLEIELFVTRSNVAEASNFVKDILQLADNPKHKLTAETYESLEKADLLNSLESIKGKFSHHYPICFRRVLPDDTLISMASGESEDWYAISFITYVEPRDDFYVLATFLANSMFELFGARIHWGKWFSQTAEQINVLYPNLDEFRNVCRQFDPHGVFRNKFIEDKLSL